MRTLKKTLALVLVVAMVFSFGAIGANAAFTDTAASGYKQAIEVLSGIGVINGMTETTFEPTGSLTREQAAKIIAYMLLGTNAQMVSTTTNQRFSDVASTRWSAGYIEYCANLGIIAGVGDEKFDPEGSLTTAAFTKMLLCALGYNATTEGLTGSSWAVNTATLAVGAGITDSAIILSAVTSCNREQACQLAYKTLTATTVQYTGGTTITIGGDTIVTGATRSSVPNNSGSGYLVAGNDLLMQFCEAKFSTLKQSTTTVNGTPSYTWKLGATTIGTYGSKAAVASWTEDHTSVIDTTVTKALSGYSYVANVAVYENGAAQADITTGYAAAIKALTGNGVKVEVFATGTEINTVVVTSTVLAQIINKDTYNKTVTVFDGTNSVTLKATSDTDLFGDAYTALYNMNVKDYVLLVRTANANVITSILSYATPTFTSGVFTSMTANKYTIGGTAYGFVSGVTTPTSADLGSTMSLTLDTYGYVISTTATSVAANYAYMIQGSKDGSAMAGYTYNAQLLFTDGTMKWVTIASWNTSDTTSSLNTAIGAADVFVTFTEKTDGTYALGTTGVNTDNTDGATITKNSPSFDGGMVSNSTVFLVYNTATKTYDVYNGISAVPSLTIGATSAVVDGAGLLASGTYKIVVVNVVGSTSGTDAIYLYKVAPTAYDYVAGIGAVHTYMAVVNGVITTVQAAADQFKGEDADVDQGMYVGNAYSNGIVINDGTETGNSIAADAAKVFAAADKGIWKTAGDLLADVITLSDGILVAENGDENIITGIVTNDFVCYVVDLSASTCSVQSLSSTAFPTAGTMYFSVDASGYIVYAIIVVA